MEVTRGRVVCSKAGRDKNTFLAVIAVDGDWILVCDGKARPLERPKKKNGKHVSVTNTLLTEEQLAPNRQLRGAFAALN